MKLFFAATFLLFSSLGLANDLANNYSVKHQHDGVNSDCYPHENSGLYARKYVYLGYISHPPVAEYLRYLFSETLWLHSEANCSKPLIFVETIGMLHCNEELEIKTQSNETDNLKKLECSLIKNGYWLGIDTAEGALAANNQLEGAFATNKLLKDLNPSDSNKRLCQRDRPWKSGDVENITNLPCGKLTDNKGKLEFVDLSGFSKGFSKISVHYFADENAWKQKKHFHEESWGKL